MTDGCQQSEKTANHYLPTYYLPISYFYWLNDDYTLTLLVAGIFNTPIP